MSQNPYEPPMPPDSPERREIVVDNVEGVDHILEAFRQAVGNDFVPGLGQKNISAHELCCAVVDWAYELTAYDPTATEALSYLAELKLGRSEDVGREVFELVNAGHFQARENESVHDFDNLYDVTMPFEEWNLNWKIPSNIAKNESDDSDSRPKSLIMHNDFAEPMVIKFKDPEKDE